MRQDNMGRSQGVISMEEYLEKRQAIKKKEFIGNKQKKNRAGEKTTALEIADLLYV